MRAELESEVVRAVASVNSVQARVRHECVLAARIGVGDLFVRRARICERRIRGM